MRKISFLFASILFFDTCQQPDLGYHIGGEVIDIHSRLPVEAVVYVEKTEVDCLLCPIEYEELDRAATNEKGHFDLEFQLKDESEKNNLILKFEAIPIGYQFGARVDGSDFGCIADHDLGEFQGYKPVNDGAFYRIELMPATFVRILKPDIPQQWIKDTLSLSTNLGSYWTHSCFDGGYHTTFRIGDTDWWKIVGEPRAIRLGNTARLSYTIRNGVVKSEGIIQVDCQWGDTTAIVLNFKQ